MKIRQQGGYTLIEIMIIVVILGVVTMAAAESLRSISRAMAQTKVTRNRDRIVGSLVQNVTENISNLQKSYDPDTTTKEKLLKPEDLPLAWDQDRVVDVSVCPGCPGRMGFYIEALPQTRGISRLTVRVTHKTLLTGFQDYVFIVSDD